MQTTTIIQKPALCKAITTDAFGPDPEVATDLDTIYNKHLWPDVLRLLHHNPHPVHNVWEVIGIAKKEYNDIEEKACDESVVTMLYEIKDMIKKLLALYIKLTFKNNIPRI